jgi:hypothetical protein
MTTASHRSPFAAMVGGVASFFDMVARSHALGRVYETPDEHFAARGTTREAEARRLLGV